jgi:hypothetical protein
MKLPKGIALSARRGAQLRLFVAATAVGASCASAADDAGTAVFKSDVSRAAVTTMPAYTVDEAQSAKTHTLFMGADIAINLDKDLYRVQDVWGSNWVVDINGHQKEISAKEAPLNLKITPNLKLTEVSATIVGFHRVQAYSYNNDPSVRLTRGLSESASLNADLLAVAGNAQHVVDTMQNKGLAGANVFAGADDQFSANAMQTTAQFAYADGHKDGGLTASHTPLPSPFAPTATSNTTGSVDANSVNIGIASAAAAAAANQTENGDEPAGRIATGGLDAMDVEFDIRSAKPLHNPYVVTMTRFRTKGAKPGMFQNMVYAQSLHPIDEHLSHVHFVEEGFPFNYEVVDFQLHIYNRGEEIATNVAADRVELTRDEAFEYVKMEYIGAHPKDTLPASPAMAKLPADLSAQLAAGKYPHAFYVKVSKEGLADAAYADAACTQRIDDSYLESVVKRIRFKPALDKGKPVDGVASLELRQLKV